MSAFCQVLRRSGPTTTAELAATEGPRLVFRLIIVLLILVFFFYLGRAAQALTKRALASSKFRVSALLNDMIVGSVKNIVIMLGILVALSQIGISLRPVACRSWHRRFHYRLSRCRTRCRILRPAC